MLSATTLATRPDFSITAVTCQDDHARWSEAEVREDYRVVLVRRGRFRRRAAGADADIDSTMAYVGAPGEEEHFAHPAGGDDCTSISLTPTLWHVMAGDVARLATQSVHVHARLDLAHRRLLATARTGDVDYALAEELLSLLAAAVGQVVSGSTPLSAQAPGNEAALVAAARQAIIEGHPASGGLLPLAEVLGVSPYRLSRSFSRELGVSVTRYRNRVRIGRALDRLEEGENSLGALAADLGFADQAHMTRTMRQYLGHTPTALRRLLAPRTP
ncbi:helix-turn-helix transcriptional regulator [Streptomyces sp. NA04227]|uniref:helix-turn-helix domain-containing protein n=1 Tax=Streptomyces sp. NA04227 TaxID=2742136 RepID=UPI0015924297|nr:helix-turn-helix domain-containing protein [Streptomyces sp. NA04227]QKW04987.1 helix-turn-helix transcriptional regulator [Streptomyces sp. NA04227]